VVVAQQMWEALATIGPSRPRGRIAMSHAPEVQVTLSLPPLKRGVSGHFEEVSCLQFMLIFTGGAYSPFERALRPSDGVDGIFGPKTEERVRLFQGNEGLTVDGIVGKNTWTKLLDRWTRFQTAG
jgi:peptidoglycan hydrolase-like protein with peptidoglycan-binding domain